MVKQPSAKKREELGEQTVKVVEREIEPLLQDANPFFGGTEKLTMAEVRGFYLHCSPCCRVR
jgi:glutathione S-transferase